MLQSSLSRFLLIATLSLGCDYINSPRTDPADPVTLSLINDTGAVIYLALNDSYSPLDAAVKLRSKDGAPFTAALSCASVSCASGCEVETCAAQRAVRELAPGEALLVEWNITRYDAGAQTCADSNFVCLVGTRAAEGRYLADVCFARAIKAAQTQDLQPARLQRLVDDGAVILGAALDGEECLQTREIGVPAYDVRHQITIR
jgi:hypothetical protein